jgi:subtilisin family serine protease
MPASVREATADGRIKPDICAMGLGVVAVNPDRNDYSEYLFVSGTSFSCPLAAGVCALVAEAHPDLTADEIREAVRMTASRSVDPTPPGMGNCQCPGSHLLSWDDIQGFQCGAIYG